jgi:hypothetical protein
MLNNHLVFVFIFLLPPSLNNTTQTKNKKDILSFEFRQIDPMQFIDLNMTEVYLGM